MDIWADPATLPARRSEKWRHYPSDVLPVWVAEADVILAEPIRAALADAVGRSDTGYASVNGLFEAYAEFSAKRYGYRPDPARMLLTPDVAQSGIGALRALTEPGDAVVINTPIYPPIFIWLEATGRRAVHSPLAHTSQGFSLDLDRLESDFAAGARAYLLCNPHNPTGVVLSRDELESIAQLAGRYGVRMIVDEIHAPLTLPGTDHVSFAKLDAEAAKASFTLVSASKAWNLAGLKCALMFGGEDTAADLAAVPGEIRFGTGLFGVLAGQAAFESGVEWLDAFVSALDSNRRLVGELLAESLPEVGYSPPAATYLAWLDFRALGLGDDPAEALEERGKVALGHGPDFGEEGRGWARLNFGTAPEVVAEAVRRMASALGRTG